MLNGLRIDDLCDIILKAQSWLVLNLPVFMFVYIHFNAHLTRITDLVRPGFHYTTNATTTTQNQSDYKVDQSSFTLIALF